KIEPKPGGQSLIRLQAFLNFASKRGVGAGAGVKLAGHDPLFLRLLINRALTKSLAARRAQAGSKPRERGENQVVNFGDFLIEERQLRLECQAAVGRTEFVNSRNMPISGVNSTPRPTAVYASRVAAMPARL